jgi:addiction module RelB/DinJ family antitoxin
MDESLKEEVSERLDALGLSFNTFVNMAAKQLVAQERIPFSLDVPGRKHELSRFEEKLRQAENEIQTGNYLTLDEMFPNQRMVAERTTEYKVNDRN